MVSGWGVVNITGTMSYAGFDDSVSEFDISELQTVQAISGYDAANSDFDIKDTANIISARIDLLIGRGLNHG